MLGVVLLQTALQIAPAEVLVPVYAHLIDEHTFPQAEYLCLGVVTDLEAWEIGDPPNGLIAAFKDVDHPVVGASECRWSAAGNVHLPTGAIAQIYLVTRSEISGLSGEIEALYHVEALLGGRVRCSVFKEPEGWEATCRHLGVF